MDNGETLSKISFEHLIATEERYVYQLGEAFAWKEWSMVSDVRVAQT